MYMGTHLSQPLFLIIELVFGKLGLKNFDEPEAPAGDSAFIEEASRHARKGVGKRA